MLVITGMFEDERFIPDEPIAIPQKKKVIVTIEEEKPIKHSAYGRLKSYAHSSLIEEEGGAWEKEAAEKYALR